MTAPELREHAGYLADRVKMEAYRMALHHSIAGGAESVLDLGTGTGVLGLLAAHEGARSVYAVDSGPIIGPAAEAARASELDTTVVHIHGRSTEIDLPERVDVAVCDQVGGFVHDAGILEYFADARRRHLRPDGILVPAGFRLFLAPASCPKVRTQLELWGSRPEGFDFSVFQELAVNTEHRIDATECEVLAAGVCVAEIAADHDRPFTGVGSAVIDRSGSCDGFVGWFEADLGGDVTLTNDPTRTGRMDRWCTFYPLADAVQVEAGDRFTIDVDVRPLLHAVTWTTVITAADGSPKTNERHSTLLGQFLSPNDLRTSSAYPIRASQVGQAIARAISLADGTLRTDEILSILRDEFDDATVTGTNEDTIRSILRRCTLLA